MKRWPFLVLVLTFAMACFRERDRSQERQELIQKTLRERIDNYQRTRMDRCREDMLSEATRLADSIMITEARLRGDSIGKPPKPNRPEKPELRQLEDTIPIKPLLQDVDSIDVQ
jgi:hypothetical protein